MHVQPKVFPPKHYTHTPHHTQSNLSMYGPSKTPELHQSDFWFSTLVGGDNHLFLQGS